MTPSHLRDAAAKIAREHKPKVVATSQWKYMERETREEIHAEQRGERVAAEIIAKAIEAMPLPSDPQDEPTDGLMEDMAKALEPFARAFSFVDDWIRGEAAFDFRGALKAITFGDLRKADEVLDRYHATKDLPNAR